jgi:hypothetical protein
MGDGGFVVDEALPYLACPLVCAMAIFLKNQLDMNFLHYQMGLLITFLSHPP